MIKSISTLAVNFAVELFIGLAMGLLFMTVVFAVGTVGGNTLSALS